MFADGGIKGVTSKVNNRGQTQRDAPRIIRRQSSAPVSPPAAPTGRAEDGPETGPHTLTHTFLSAEGGF